MFVVESPWKMTIDLAVIENLGLKMYVTLPPVISEIIANSWDADAKVVDINLPIGNIDGESQIIINDNGIGMTSEEINDKFLRIGRKRREEEDRDISDSGRKLMGRKGIGKLAPFGVAQIVEIETCKNYISNSFRMEIRDVLKSAKKREDYLPFPININKETEKKEGTMVILKSLNRRTPIDIPAYRRGIAKRFSIIQDDFVVKVNGDNITPEDWLKKEDMQYTWNYEDEEIYEKNPEWKINGWIGTTEKPLDEEQRGVIIMTRGKLCQDTPFYFGASVGQRHAYAYITGILHAEFIDNEEDYIATHRSSIVWESPIGLAFLEWGKDELKRIAREWDKNRREKREKIIREDPEFKEWLKTLPRAEKRLADKVITAITKDERIDDDRRKELAIFMKDSFEQQVFQEMIATLPENPEDARLIEIFEEWGFIEAKEILRIVRGRIKTIEQFVKYVKDDALEKPTIHNFFKDWPWILDPTWTRWNDEVYFSQLLRENFPDEELDEPNRRIDFVCIGVGDTVHIVELKRPSRKINADDLEQLLRYVAFVRRRLGNVQDRSYRDAAGYIIGGDEADDDIYAEKKLAFRERRMYIKRYADLIVVAQKLHEDFRKKLEEFEKRRRDRLEE